MGDGSWRSEKRQVPDQTLMQMPKEIVMNILSRICRENLLRSVRYVCKKWYFLIKDNEFAHLHMERTRISSSALELVAISYAEAQSLFRIELYSIPDSDILSEWRDDEETTIPVDGELSLDYNFVGSINGLISFHKVNTNTAFVFNPLTKEMATLPPNKPYKLAGPSWSNVPNDEYGVDVGWLSATGFGFCDVNKEYKLVHVYLLDPMLQSSDHQHHHHVIEVEMICLGRDHCWRKPKGRNMPRMLPVGNAVVLGKVMYWLAYPVRPSYMPSATRCSTGIVWFDVSCEDFGMIACPYVDFNVCYNQRLLVGEAGDELCLISHCSPRWRLTSRYDNIELVMWTLKHPMTQQTWAEQCRYFAANRQLQDRFSVALCVRHGAYVVRYFCEIEHCWLIVFMKGDRQRIIEVLEGSRLAAVVPYEPSLVSPPTTPTPN